MKRSYIALALLLALLSDEVCVSWSGLEEGTFQDCRQQLVSGSNTHEADLAGILASFGFDIPVSRVFTTGESESNQ